MHLRKMDYLIGVNIMGYEPSVSTLDLNSDKKIHRLTWTNQRREHFLFNPSTSAEHAKKLIQRMIDTGFEFRIYGDRDKWICSFSKKETHYAISKYDNEAICRAALKAIEVEL